MAMARPPLPSAIAQDRSDRRSNCWRSMIFSENRFPPRIKSGASFFRIMLRAIDTPQERYRRLTMRAIACGYRIRSRARDDNALGLCGILSTARRGLMSRGNGQSGAQPATPSSSKNSRSACVVLRPSTRLRCGNRPNFLMTSRCSRA